MMNEAVLKQSAMLHLIDKFGVVEAERFISLVAKDPFDYAKWRRGMYEGVSVRELSREAMRVHAGMHPQGTDPSE